MAGSVAESKAGISALTERKKSFNALTSSLGDIVTPFFSIRTGAGELDLPEILFTYFHQFLVSVVLRCCTLSA